MYQVIIVIHVLLGLGVVGLVMMQHGKGADAGAAFGTGSSGSVFGAQGAASFLSRTTAILAGLFFLTSLGLAILNSHKGTAYDLMSAPATTQQDSIVSEIEKAAPVTPAVVAPEIKAEVAPKVEATPAAVVPTPVEVKVEEVKPAVTEAPAPVVAQPAKAVEHVEKAHVPAKAETHEKHAVTEKHHEKAKHHDADKKDAKK